MAVVLKVKNHFVSPMPQLMRLALKFIYEENNMSSAEKNLMEESIVHWNNKVTKTPEETYNLQRIGYILKQNAEGALKERKKSFKKHNINYKKFHRFPEYGPYAF